MASSFVPLLVICLGLWGAWHADLLGSLFNTPLSSSSSSM